MTSVPRQTSLNIRGLVTTPNEYGVYPEGACKEAVNVLARSAHQWTVARDLVLARAVGFADRKSEALVEIRPGLYVLISRNVATEEWTFNLEALNTQGLVMPGFPAASAIGICSSQGYLQPLKLRGRLFLNGTKGPMVLENLSTLDPTVAADREMRWGGLVKPSINAVSAQNADVIPPGTVVAYSAVILRRGDDGYVMRSAPSAPVRVRSSTGNAQEFVLRVSWFETTDVQLGDVVEVYRTAGIPGATVSEVDPGTSMRLAASAVIGSGQIAIKEALVFDRKVMESPLYETGGEEIYTSPYQEGAIAANLTPPVCKTQEQWGDYTFYGNVDDEPSWLVDVPVGFINEVNGALNASERAYGIGTRRITSCTITSGSATVTGISAAEIVGLAVGQIWVSGVGFSPTAIVVTVGASSIVMSEVATSSGTTGILSDRVEINGVVSSAGSLQSLVSGVQGKDAGAGVVAFPSETVPYGASPAVISGVTVLFRPPRSGTLSEITARATNGANYSPPIPNWVETPDSFGRSPRPNVLRWSKPNQPEAVPASNEAFAGAGDIIRLLSTTDQLWILCTDGLRRLTGAAGQWQIDMVEPGFVPVGPLASCVMFDTLYSYTKRGVSAMRGIEPEPLSRGLIDDIFPVRQFEASPRFQLVANETDEEVLVLEAGEPRGADSTLHVYSTLYKQWSSLEFTDRPITAMCQYDRGLDDTPPTVLFGATFDVAPGFHVQRVLTWTGTSLEASIQLQPFYADDPLLLKQWVDVTWIVHADDPPVGSVTVNGQVFSGLAFWEGAEFGLGDQRLAFGVPRRAAISERISVGLALATAGNDLAKIKGVSLRLVPLTNQGRRR